jgi:hypothetical protein
MPRMVPKQYSASDLNSPTCNIIIFVQGLRVTYFVIFEVAHLFLDRRHDTPFQSESLGLVLEKRHTVPSILHIHVYHYTNTGVCMNGAISRRS